MELRQLRYFVHVAEEEHVGRAARRLHITQSPLSRQIQGLERELGVALFERRRGGISLTEAGRSLLDEARLILRQVERARREVVRAGHGGPQQLELTAVDSAILSGALPAALRALRQRLPRLALSLSIAEPEVQLELLSAGRVDGAVLPDAALSDRQLEALVVDSEPMLLALPADDLRAPAPDLTLADLRGDRWIGLHRSQWPCLHDESLRLCRQHGFTPELSQCANGLVSLLGLVQAGCGVALVTGSARSFAPPGVTLRAVPGLDRALQTLLVWRRDNRSSALRALIDALQAGGRPAAPVRGSSSSGVT